MSLKIFFKVCHLFTFDLRISTNYHIYVLSQVTFPLIGDFSIKSRWRLFLNTTKNVKYSIASCIFYTIQKRSSDVNLYL